MRDVVDRRLHLLARQIGERPRRRLPFTARATTFQPEAFDSLAIQKADLRDVELVAEDAVDPLRVAGPSDIDLVLLLAGNAADQGPGLRQPRQQPDTGVPTGQMLIQIAEVCAQVLQKRRTVEQVDTLQDQR